MVTKDTNPKDAVGIKKAPMSTIPATVLCELGVAMLEGARKYGRHNYRTSGVRASVYYDAVFRHMVQWWEGEDIDPDSGLSHITKAIASLVVLRDAMVQNMFEDDRPPKSKEGWLRDLQPVVEEMFVKHPTSKTAFTQKDRDMAKCQAQTNVGHFVEMDIHKLREEISRAKNRSSWFELQNNWGNNKCK
jgi:hypothetical protein